MAGNTAKRERATDAAGLNVSLRNQRTLGGIDCDTSGRPIVVDEFGNALGTVRSAGQVLSAVGATVGVSSTAEAVSASVTIPANQIKLGSRIRIFASGTTPTTNGTDTCVVRIRIGPTTLTGTVAVLGSAVDVANNSFFATEFEITSRAAAGASAAMVGAGWLSNFGTTATGTSPVAQLLASTNFATNGALRVEVTFQFSASSAGNSARCEQLIVEVN